MNYGYLQHGFFGHSKADHKYVRKYMGSSGKWIYVYADDLKKKAEGTVSKMTTNVKQVKSMFNKPVTLSSIKNGVVARGEKYIRNMQKSMENMKAGYVEGSTTGRNQQQIYKKAVRDYRHDVAMAEKAKKEGNNKKWAQYSTRAADINRKARQMMSTSFGLGAAVGSLQYKATHLINKGKRYVGGHRTSTNNVRR